MNIVVIIQNNILDNDMPKDDEINTFVAILLTRLEIQGYIDKSQLVAEIVIRFVDIKEITLLNRRYRNINKPTNVLSFVDTTRDMPSAVKVVLPKFLGDIVICSSIVKEEALAQDKTLTAHFLHILMHAILHLAGFDHKHKVEATAMQDLEIELLSGFGVSNPYATR